MTKPETLSEFIEADAEIQRLRSEMTATREAATVARRAALSSMCEVVSLLRASEASRRQMWKLEGIEGEKSETLDELTGDCAECWWGNWSNAEDAAMTQCAKVATLAAKWRKLDSQGETLQLTHNLRVGQVRAEWWKLERQAKAEQPEAATA